MVDFKTVNKESKKNPEAKVTLARMYMTGIGVAQNQKTGIKLLNSIANDNANAMYCLAYYYANGIGVALNEDKARNYLEKAVEKEHAYAIFAKSICLKYGYLKYDVDEKAASELLKKASEGGVVEADFVSAQDKESRAKDILKDEKASAVNKQNANALLKQAMDVYHKASEKGCESADYVLGVKYSLGEDVQQDTVKGMDYLEKAASKKDAKAYYAIGYLYDMGIGVAQDYWIAFDYYMKSYKAGNKRALLNLGYSALTGFGCDLDYKVALDYYREAKLNGFEEANFYAGLCYQYGWNVNIDVQRAINLYEQAADIDFPQAQYKLGTLYDKRHDGYIQNKPAKALEYYTKAADGGFEAAKIELGLAYRDGFDKIAKDEEKAKELIFANPDTKNARALVVMGECYRDGLLVEKDLAKSTELYEKAATAGSMDACKYMIECLKDGKNGIEKDRKKANLYIEKLAMCGGNKYYELGVNYFYGTEPFDKDYEKAVYWFAMTIRKDDKKSDTSNSKKMLELFMKDDEGHWGLKKEILKAQKAKAKADKKKK